MFCLLIIASVNIAFIHNKKKRESLRISQGFAIAFIIIIIILLCIYFATMYTKEGCENLYNTQHLQQQ
jgi:amino acid permease